MEQITLTNSFVHQQGEESRTFFIARQNGRCGLVAAGSWETVLPFCFEDITPCREDLVAVCRGGERRLYRITADGERFLALPAILGGPIGGSAMYLPA